MHEWMDVLLTPIGLIFDIGCKKIEKNLQQSIEYSPLRHIGVAKHKHPDVEVLETIIKWPRLCVFLRWYLSLDLVSSWAVFTLKNGGFFFCHVGWQFFSRIHVRVRFFQVYLAWWCINWTTTSNWKLKLIHNLNIYKVSVHCSKRNKAVNSKWMHKHGLHTIGSMSTVFLHENNIAFMPDWIQYEI